MAARTPRCTVSTGLSDRQAPSARSDPIPQPERGVSADASSGRFGRPADQASSTRARHARSSATSLTGQATGRRPVERPFPGQIRRAVRVKSRTAELASAVSPPAGDQLLVSRRATDEPPPECVRQPGHGENSRGRAYGEQDRANVAVAAPHETSASVALAPGLARTAHARDRDSQPGPPHPDHRGRLRHLRCAHPHHRCHRTHRTNRMIDSQTTVRGQDPRDASGPTARPDLPPLARGIADVRMWSRKPPTIAL